MTFEDLANFVCNKMNQTDSSSFSACSGFINRRYEMIWDSENWLDTLLSTFLTLGVGDSAEVLDDRLERAITVSILRGPIVEKVDRKFMLEAHPELITGLFGEVAFGIPLFYEEVIDTFGAHTLVFYPPSDEVRTLEVWGKKQFVPLVNPTDAPIIRNIDNCLIAFVFADMLERARQFAKSKEKITEAGTLLELMRKVEKEQSNKPRATKVITVGGDSLGEMVDSVCARIDSYSATTQIMVRDYLRRNYLDVYNSQLWPESLVIAQVPRDGSEVILPEYFDQIISLRGNSQLAELVPVNEATYFGINPQIFEQSGSPIAFSRLTPVGVAQLPPVNEFLSFVSSSTMDKSPIFVRGETQGIEVSETVILDGTTPVKTSNTYDTPLTVSKGLTIGDITVTGFTSGTVLVGLLSRETERKHHRLWLQPTPQTRDGTTVLALGKRRIQPLLTDQDTPILRGIGNILIFAATADWLGRPAALGGDPAAAKSMQDRATAALETLISREVKQAAYAPRVVPYTDGPGYGGDNSRLYGLGLDYSFLPKG
jgi:hypothetical protein